MVALDQPEAAVEGEGERADADHDDAGAERQDTDDRRSDQLAAEDGTANHLPLQGLVRLVAELAPEHAQLAVVVPEELELAEPVAAAVAEVSLTAGAVHVVAARNALDEDLALGTALRVHLAVGRGARPGLEQSVALAELPAAEALVPGRVTGVAPGALAGGALERLVVGFGPPGDVVAVRARLGRDVGVDQEPVEVLLGVRGQARADLVAGDELVAADVAALDLDAVLAYARGVVALEARRTGGEAAAGAPVQRHGLQADAALGDAPGADGEVRFRFLASGRQGCEVRDVLVPEEYGSVSFEARLEETKHFTEQRVVVVLGRLTGARGRRRGVVRGRRAAGIDAAPTAVVRLMLRMRRRLLLLLSARGVTLRVGIWVITSKLRALGSEREEETLENEAQLLQIGRANAIF